MANEFKVKNGLIVDAGGAQITGGITGSTDFNTIVNKPTLISGSAQVVEILSSLNTHTGSVSDPKFVSIGGSTASLNLFTASAAIRLTNLETTSASVNISITNHNASSASQQISINSLNTYTASNDTTNTTQNNRLTNLETTSASVNGHITDINSKTGSYARTNVSNIFSADQTITGSLYISANLIVQGSSSLNVISQSTLNIGTNLITVNVQNPASRFGGLAVIDSGSSPQRSGSWLFDSINDNWIFIHQNAANITSSVALMGAPTYNNVGNETYPTQNRLVKGLGYEHIGDSNILDTGTEISLNSLTSVTGSFVVSGNITGTIRATNGIVSGSSQISLAGTSDYTSLFGGIASATSSLNLFTASNANTSLNSFTASAALRLTNLETTSASVNISVSNLNTYSASVSNSIQQLNIFTSSAALRLTNLETTSASVNISITNLNTYSASVSNSIGNINAFTSSENTKSSTLATYTGSNDTKWSTLQNVTSSLIARTGSYAITGSNSFLGNQTITGSLVVSGSLNVIGGVFLDSGGFNRTGTQGAYSIAIGSGQSIGLASATGDNSVSIGGGASTTGIDAIAIGNGATGGNYSVAIGRGVTSATNEFVVGQAQSPITTMIVGSSRLGLSNAAGNNLSITPSPGNGADFAGGSITIAGGRGTGTGSSGDVIFATAIPTTAGSTLQTSIQRWWIKGQTGTLTNKGTSSLAALDISGSSIFTGSINITGSLNILGNVGIGTSAPIARLNIVGSGSTLSTNTLVVQNSTPSTLFLIRDDGNVGIGTNSPSYSLDVNGGISAKMPSYSSTGFQILNADGVADWKIINAGSTTTDRPFIQVPRWSTGTPIIISNSNRNQGAVNDAIMIGGGVPNNGDVLANKSIRIGKNSNTLIGTGAIVIGTGNAQGDYSISISSDQYGIPIGSVPNNNSFWIGSSVEGATNEANQGVLGAINVFIGRPARSSSFTGNLAQGTATSINGMGGYGTTNSTGGNLNINGGVGLGSGTPGDVIIGTATSASSGTTLQTLTDRVWIKNSTGNVGIGTSTPNSKLDVSGSTIITNALAIGTSSLGSTENTLTIGLPPAGGTGEGGQILLQASGGLYTSASMWDNYQNQTRLLRGTNAGSDGLVVQWNMHTKQMQLPAYNSVSAFAGTAAANLAVNSNGDVITVSTTGGSVFPYTGNAQINGGLGVTGSIATSTIFLATNTNGAAYLRGGDGVELWDINVANHIGIYGQQDQTIASIKLGSGGGIISGKNGNIGIGTINPSSGSLHVTGSIFAASITGAIAATNGVVSGSSQVIGILSSLNTYTGSNDTTNTTQNSRLTNLESATASLLIETTNLELFSASALTRFTNLESKSASVDISITNLNARSASQQISIDSINSKTGSFATTGSNTFIGNQTISGSLFISGSTIQTGSFTINNNAGTTASFSGDPFTFSRIGNTLSFFAAAGGVGNDSVLYSSTTLRMGGGSNAAQLVLDSSGNKIGINKASPNAALDVNGNVIITGSLTVTNGITGSLFGTASFALNGSSNAIMYQTASAASTWVFNHFLATPYPVVTVYDNNNSVIIPQSIVSNNSSSLTITFSSARTGVAVASKGGYVGSAVATATVANALTTARLINGTSFDGTQNITIPNLVSGSTQIKSYGDFATTGSNTFIGNQTITGNITSSSDIRVNSITVGRGGGNQSQNTAVGNGALKSNTTQIFNTAIGSDALPSASAQGNTAVGAVSMRYTTTGGSNSAFGYGSLFDNINGTFNSAFGYGALGGNTTGTYNVAIGAYAGDTLPDGVTYNTTSDNSIFIGYATSPSSSNGQNEIVIGDSAKGNGSNTVTLGNTSITNTYLRGQVSASAFSGSLFGTSSWARNALTASFINPLVQNVTITGSIVVSGSLNNIPTLQLFGSGSTIFTISGSNSELFKIVDTPTSPILATISSGSLNVLTVTTSSVVITGSLLISGSMTASLQNGFALVGGPNNTSRAVATSSFGGGGGGTPGGSNTQIQYNNSSTFGGVPVLTYDGTTLRATGSFTGSFTGSLFGTMTASLQNGFVLVGGPNNTSIAVPSSSLASVPSSIPGQIILTAGGGWPSITSGSNAPVLAETATNRVNFYYLGFPDTIQTFANWSMAMPSDYNGGTITAVFYWIAGSASTNSVRWGLAARAYADSDVLDQAFGTAQEVTDANQANDDVNISAATPAITIAGTPAAGNFVQFRAYRNPADANDTLAATAELLSIRITYTRT